MPFDQAVNHSPLLSIDLSTVWLQYKSWERIQFTQGLKYLLSSHRMIFFFASQNLPWLDDSLCSFCFRPQGLQEGLSMELVIISGNFCSWSQVFHSCWELSSGFLSITGCATHICHCAPGQHYIVRALPMMVQCVVEQSPYPEFWFFVLPFLSSEKSQSPKASRVMQCPIYRNAQGYWRKNCAQGRIRDGK